MGCVKGPARCQQAGGRAGRSPCGGRIWQRILWLQPGQLRGHVAVRRESKGLWGKGQHAGEEGRGVRAELFDERMLAELLDQVMTPERMADVMA